jgi:hypothetical protein
MVGKMSTAEKFLGGIIAIGTITTLILPKRNTIGVINAFTNFVRGSLATAMGTGKKV